VLPGHFSIKWPVEYTNPGSAFSADQIRDGFRRLGVRVDAAQIPQLVGEEHIVLFAVSDGADLTLLAFDHDDRPGVREDVAHDVLVYFKQQYASAGYDVANVVPGGYTPANGAIYKYLPILRARRALGRFRYDVYGRFGLQWGGREIRRRAHEVLSARDDFRYEGSLFRYPGGPDKVPYRRYLFEIPRAKVCVDMPGKGDFCTRLIDYLAVGACVVRPISDVRLPVRLVDGVHVVYCERDLSDLGDICAELVRDDEYREFIARNARDYFDRHIDRRQLAQVYLDDITDAQAGVVPAPRPRSERVALATGARALSSWQSRRRSAESLAIVVVALLVALVLFELPEAFGDRPYDPQPSRVLRDLK